MFGGRSSSEHYVEALSSIMQSVQTILTNLQDEKVNKNRLINELKDMINESINENKLIEPSKLFDSIILTSAINNDALIEYTIKSINQYYLYKKNQDDKHLTNDIMMNWISEFLRTISLVIRNEEKMIQDITKELIRILSHINEKIDVKSIKQAKQEQDEQKIEEL